MIDELDLSVGDPEAPRVDIAGLEPPPEDPLEALGDVATGATSLIDPEATARSGLQLVAEAARMFLGEPDHPELWRFEDELDQIAPALARWAGRNATLAGVLNRSDEAVVVMGLGRYTLRNLNNKREIRRERDTEQRPPNILRSLPAGADLDARARHPSGPPGGDGPPTGGHDEPAQDSDGAGGLGPDPWADFGGPPPGPGGLG
ncbi:MAG TPA: hypothetical protein VFD01_16990 [Candidatus Dormibacteraeota bacterium]|nr:hypothetical protein [Candidatus Dormibacteraeota bacterium]